MKTAMYAFKWALFVLIIPFLYLIGIILWAQITQYRPAEREAVQFLCGEAAEMKGDLPDTLTCYTWNIGYAGLGKESDFFYDGGRTVRPELKVLEKNYHGIIQEILTWKNDADFILLQEVDMKARRSHGMLQAESIARAMQDRSYQTAIFAKNYDVQFVPMPLSKPMGKVISGILSLSRFTPFSAERVSYPANFPWPKGLFFLNRCFTIERYPFQGKEVLVINTHNSAFDGGTLKKQEMDFLKRFLIEEYAKGNYIIAGGDWNQIPPGYSGNPLSQYEETPVPVPFPAPGWQWVADLQHRSNRKVDTPYVPGSTYTTILDFFLLSPNIAVLDIKGKDMGFEFSDHQPVRIKVKLLPNLETDASPVL
jgi:endonuclease/exonuclease/phosphatase family metal-dependent hydrolase